MLIELALMASLYTDLNQVTEEPTLVAPMADVPTVVEAPYFAWGLRPAIRDIKRDLGLDIIYRRDAECDRYPDRRCITVTRQFLPDEEWLGYYEYTAEGGYTITLNDSVGNEYPDLKDNASAHEFGHFLGFSHHDNSGLMSVDDWWDYNRPSDEENEVLFDYYVE